MELEHNDTYPAEIVEKMKELGLFGSIIERGVRRAGPVRPRPTRRSSSASPRVWMSLSGIFNSHLIMASAVQRYGTEEQKRRGCRNSLAGKCAAGWRSPSPTAAPTCRRSGPRAVQEGQWLRRQRHEDLDLQRHLRHMLRRAGEDRPASRTAAPGNESVPDREGRRVSSFRGSWKSSATRASIPPS